MNPSNNGGNSTQTLAVEAVGKSFAGLRALDNVSFGMQQGEILGVIGPNGSGKTTLINVITGLLPATDGKVKVCGEDVTNRPSYEVAKAGISRTFQTIRLFRELTVFENAEVAAISVGAGRKEARERAAAALDVMGIGRWADQSAGALPYGHERRAEIARALSMAPKFLLLDEPAAGLNEDESDELLAILTPLPQSMNLGMLIVEHDMRLIMRLCHRLHVLNYGKTIGEGTPEEIRKIPAVIEAYLGKNQA
jgi:ABC-type branched-subunit amino acid transport system ATPase component